MNTQYSFSALFLTLLALLVAPLATVHAMEMQDASMMKKDTMGQASGTMMHDDMMKKDTMLKESDTMAKMAMEDGEDLYLGMKGEKVSMLQTFLEEKGHLKIPQGVAKGYFGNLTKMALMQYQSAMGVKATGYYGPLTRKAKEMHMMTGKDTMMHDDMMKKTQ